MEYNTRYEREFQWFEGFYQVLEVEEKKSGESSLLQSAAAGAPCCLVVDWRNRLEERKWESLGF